MKKILSLALLSFTLLQSCTHDELDVAPKQALALPAGLNIENAAKQISETFILSGAKALLLKPVDSDPNTHLTTLYFADAKGKITPVIENFEVKQVEVTKTGIYVATNYSDIGFFVKYDNTWIQLDTKYPFFAADENGDIAFRNGDVLRTTNTLSLENADWLKNYLTNIDFNQFDGSYGNYMMFKGNPVTDYSHTIFNPFTRTIFGRSHNVTEILSVDNDKFYIQLFEDKGLAVAYPSTYATKWFDNVNPQQMVLNLAGDGIIMVDYPNENGDLIKTEATFSYDNMRGEISMNIISQEKWYGGTLKPVPPAQTALKMFLKDTNPEYTQVGSVVYYTGTAHDNLPVTGYYDFTSKVNTVVNRKLYSSINPL